MSRRHNNAPRHVRSMVLAMAENKALSARKIADSLPGINRYNVMQWLAGKERPQLAEGTIDRIIEVVLKGPKVP
jgi:hypothetical protein